MSLLMEALKKAEEAKRLAAENSAPTTTPPDADLTLAPLDAPKPERSYAATRSPLPELSLHIDSVDADLAAVSTDPVRRHSPAKDGLTQAAGDNQVEREAARNVFSAKQAADKPRSSLPLILGVGAVAMLALGTYFWWQLQALSRNTLSPLTTIVATGTPAQNASRTEAAVTKLDAAPITTTVSESTRPPTSPEPTAQARPTPPKEASLFGDERPAPRPRPASAPKSAPEPERLVRITKNQPKPNQTIETAYDALLAGQFDLAQRNYDLVLRSDPKNTDALLGLATIAFSRGESDRAYQYYLAALESNPTNATAQAGLIATGGQSDPGLAESRLKTALSGQPDSSALHFALGNLYARQARWGEAQQAFFNAYSIEPDNADFIFNQAVSLDHLHQTRLAAQYYRMALDTADRDGIARPVAFDREQVRTRIRQLQP